MSLFITRVELHSATENDYQALHTAMANLGFTRFVVGMDRANYQLPSAMYSIESNRSVVNVNDYAQRAANTTGKPSWVLTIQSQGMAWELRKI